MEVFAIGERLNYADFEPVVVLAVYPQSDSQTRYKVALGLGGIGVVEEDKLKPMTCCDCGAVTGGNSFCEKHEYAELEPIKDNWTLSKMRARQAVRKENEEMTGGTQ